MTSETELTSAVEPSVVDRDGDAGELEPEDRNGDLAASDPPRPGNRFSAQFNRFVRRDIFGVNAAVLLFVLAPLAFGYYARLHWSAYSFPPDSRYYVVMALRDLGWGDAHALTKQFANSGVVAEPWYFAHSDPAWLMVQSRMLYPFFAAPFVAVFGVTAGMPLAAMAAFATMLWAVTRLVQRLYGPTAALAAGGVLGACGFLMTLAEAVTDSVAIAVLALILLNLPLGRRARANNLIALALLSVLLELSRQVMPTAAVMAFSAYVWATLFPGRGRPRRWRNDWLWPSLIVGGTTVFVHLLEAKLSGRGAGSQVSQVAANPFRVAWTITDYDVLSTLQGDKALSMLLAGALLFVVVRFTDIVAGLLLGALAGTYVIMIAGVDPSHMRYESIMFPVAGLAIGALFHHLAPPSLRGGVVGEGTLRSDRLPPVDTWWQRGPRRIPGARGVQRRRSGVPRRLVGHARIEIHGRHHTHGALSSRSHGRKLPRQSSPPASYSAEETLSEEFTQAENMLQSKTSVFLIYADWRHPMHFRPLAANEPGWNHRGADGTVVIYPGDLASSDWTGLAKAFTYNGTLDPRHREGDLPDDQPLRRGRDLHRRRRQDRPPRTRHRPVPGPGGAARLRPEMVFDS